MKLIIRSPFSIHKIYWKKKIEKIIFIQLKIETNKKK